MSEIYKRLQQIVDYKGFKSVNEFALKGLNYSSAEKLNRLKRENTAPGWDIIHDIANKFADIDMNWFVTGRGAMVAGGTLQGINEPAPEYKALVIDAKNETIEILKKENQDLKDDKDFLKSLLKSKIINQ